MKGPFIMSEVIIARGGMGGVASSSTATGNAVIRITTDSGTSFTVTDGNSTYTKTATSSTVEFGVGYGSWTVTGTYGTNTSSKVVEVDSLKIYTIQMRLKQALYGICIDMSNTDPDSAVTYTDDAVGMTPLTMNLANGVVKWGDWEYAINDGAISCKPCLYLNGSRSVYLDPDDYSKDVDGNSVDITSGSSGDVMVEFKRTWYKWYISGNYLYFKVADYQPDSSYVSTAFYSMYSSTSSVQDYMYYGAYEGYNSSNKIRSLSGKTPTGSITIGNSRTYCKANGNKYGMEDWAKRCYILGLTMLVTKCREIQGALGQGNTSTSVISTTGTRNNAGLFSGTSSGTIAIKLFGIENFYGSQWQWCDGLVTGSSTTVKLGAVHYGSVTSYTDGGTNYTSVTDGNARGPAISYPTKMGAYLGGAVIFPTASQYDSTKGWPDDFYVNSSASYVAYVGGRCDDGAVAGPFYLGIYSSASNTNAYVGCRLVAS